MPILKVSATATSASATSVKLELNGRDFELTKNAAIWKGEQNLDLEGTVAVLFGASGFTGTAWQLDIAVTCPNGTAVTKLSKQDTIPVSMKSRFEGSMTIPPDPCGHPAQGEHNA
jgi:hypothetical protein